MTRERFGPIQPSHTYAGEVARLKRGLIPREGHGEEEDEGRTPAAKERKYIPIEEVPGTTKTPEELLIAKDEGEDALEEEAAIAADKQAEALLRRDEQLGRDERTAMDNEAMRAKEIPTETTGRARTRYGSPLPKFQTPGRILDRK